MKKKNRRITFSQLKKIVTQVFLVILSIFTLYPVFYIYNNSLKTNSQINSSFLSVTKTFYIDGFKYIIIEKKAGLYLFNTIFVVLGAVLICLTLSILVSYRVSRFNIKFGNIIYIVFLFGIILSHQTSIVPIFIILRTIKLLNTFFGLMLAYSAWNLSITILIITPFFRSIPRELQDAARIDGCSNFGFLFRVMLPLAKAPIGTASLLSILFIWNDLIFPLTLIQSPNLKLVSSSLMYYKGQFFTNYNILFSAIAFMIFPLIVLYILTQRLFASGVFQGAVIE